MSDNPMVLKDGDTVCVVGGGPGGSACAVALKKEAKSVGKNIHVVVIEPKKFNEHRHYNQCIGVLSPPLETILDENLGICFTQDLVLKEMKQYCIHSDRLHMNLHGEEDGKTYAVSRIKFDALMLEEARKSGAEIRYNRVTGMEVNDDGVLVYSDGDNCKAQVVVGAFGMDEGTAQIFEQATPYRQPDCLNTIITHIYPGQEFLDQVGPSIQAFLLSMKGVEFGAVTPKIDHLSINIAGRRVSSKVMLEFLRSDPVQRFLPPHKRREKPLKYFKGKFPIAPATGFFGDRYVTIGDAAGLMRPFKGKGINSACLTGIYVARSIVHHGFSGQAFENHFYKDCEDLTGDLPYGRVIRLLTNLCTRLKFMDHLLVIAAMDSVFRSCMFNCVSGQKSYKTIFRETASLGLGFSFLREMFKRFILNYPARFPSSIKEADIIPASVERPL